MAMRRIGILLGCLLVACSFDSASNGAGSVSDAGGTTSTAETGEPQGTTAGSVTASGSTSPTTGSTSMDPTTETSSTTTGEATNGEESTTTGDAQSSSTTTGEPQGPLSDDGLVARYYLDEAAMGTAPTLAFDAAEEPLDLTLDYADGTMRYVEEFGHRGLAFDDAGQDDGARVPIAGTKLAGIEGATTLTIEVVLRLDDAVTSGSRIVHIGQTDSGVATLSARNPDELQVAWNGRVVRRWDYSPYSGSAHVVHVVVDTATVNEASQFRLLVDGVELPPADIVDSILTGEPASALQAASILGLGNRNQDRAMQGVLFYAAIYGIALGDEVVATHVSALQDDDDTP